MKKLLLTALLSVAAFSEVVALNPGPNKIVSSEDGFIFLNPNQVIEKNREFVSCMVSSYDEKKSSMILFCLKEEDPAARVTKVHGQIKNNEIFFYDLFVDMKKIDISRIK